MINRVVTRGSETLARYSERFWSTTALSAAAVDLIDQSILHQYRLGPGASVGYKNRVSKNFLSRC